MKQILLFVLLIGTTLLSFSQSCNSLRYQDTIFHSVTVITSQFGTATPYGLLAQPQDLFLDFYEPTGDTLSKRPLIIFQFGGGFTIGWRSQPDIPGFCNYFAKCGYAVASIDYRIGLNPVDTGSTVRAFYRGVQDERAAIRYLVQRAQQFKIDTTNLILTGTSAGCFCAFANAFTTDAQRSSATFGTLLEPADLGCYDCSGNSDLGHHIPHIKAIVNQWGAIVDTSFITSNENTPVISFHGDQDNAVPYVYGYPFQLPVFPQVYGSKAIHERLNHAGITNVLHPLVGFGHEPELLNPQLNDTVYNYARPFLFDLLKPNTSVITGGAVVCQNSITHYSVQNTVGSKYCWSITANGTLISNNGNSIAVQWNDTGYVEVRVKELNYILAEGEEKLFQTYVALQPTALFSFTTNELHVEFLNTSTTNVNYQWSFGDGDTTSAFNPIKDYASGGTYTVSLIAANNFCADTFAASLTIDSCPVADITFQLTNYNAFFYSPTTNTTSYFWNFGDGDSASVNSPNVFHQYAQDGSYFVVLKVENQLGCEELDTLTIQVQSPNAISAIENEVLVQQTENDLQIKSQHPGNYRAEIFDVTGRKMSEALFSFNHQLSIINFSAGIYLLKISDGENILLRKFLK